MAVIISDSFNRSDSTTSLGTADSGQTYVVGGSATFGINGNQGYAATSTQDNTGAYIVISTGVRNYTAQISVPTMQTATVNFFRFYVRALMGGLLAYVAVEAHSSGYRITKRETTGTITVIGTSTKVPANGDVIKVDHFDTGLMDVYINGTKYLSVTDSNLLASAYGVGFGGKQAPTYRVDDFSVQDLATGTTHNGAASITGVSTITASATVIPAAITGSASLQGVATMSATADVVNAPMLGSASLQGVGTATATASVIRSGSANIMGVSTLTASAAGLSVLGGASLTGVGWVMCSAIEGQFIVSVVSLKGVQSFVIALQGSKEQTIQVLGLKDNIVLLEGEI